MKKEKIVLALVGATGLVGSTAINVLEERKLDISEYIFFSSKKSANSKIKFMGKEYIVKELNEENLLNNGITHAIFCAGGAVSEKFIPIAKENGIICIDNSSKFRMTEGVPLVVTRVNKEEILKNAGIIANPNCSTIQAMLPLNIIDKLFEIKRINVTSFQAASGAGLKGINGLKASIKGEENDAFSRNLAKNVIPQIGGFAESGYSEEEEKIMNESAKILGIKKGIVTATTVRVPVLNSHSEAINVETFKKIDLDKLRKAFENQEGIILMDDPNNNIFPVAEDANGQDDVLVGRLRLDHSTENALNFWCVADNVRRGAATNAVDILEELLKEK